MKQFRIILEGSLSRKAPGAVIKQPVSSTAINLENAERILKMQGRRSFPLWDDTANEICYGNWP